MATPHLFEGRLTWRAGGNGVAAGNHEVQFEGRPPLALSGAPQYKAILHASRRRTSSSRRSLRARC